MKRYIRAATYNGFDESEFDYWQLEEIQEGLEKGLDISWYADPKFDDDQMYEIVVGLSNGLDVSWYADPKYSWRQMAEILSGLMDGVDVSQYADPKYDEWQMRKIRDQLTRGHDTEDEHSSQQELHNSAPNTQQESRTADASHEYYVEYYAPYDNELYTTSVSADDDWNALYQISEELNIPYVSPEIIDERHEEGEWGDIKDALDAIYDSNLEGGDYVQLIQDTTSGNILFEDNNWSPEDEY